MFLKDLADQLTSGQIGIPEWQMQMKEFIRVTHREAAIVAYGGVENMTQAAWGFEGSLVKKQYQYLDQFAADIAANPSAWMNGRLFVRMDLYRKSEWGTFEEMLRFQKRQEGWTEERRALGASDHCDGCVQQASLQWRPLGTLDTIGSQQCSTNCHCVFHYRRPNGNGGWVYDNGTGSAGNIQVKPQPVFPVYKPDINLENKLIEQNARIVAQRLKKTPNQVISEFKTKFTSLIDDKETSLVKRAQYKDSIKIVEDGRFKTQFETNTSNGMVNQQKRAEAEFNGIGIPKDIDPKQRPIYGIVYKKGIYDEYKGSKDPAEHRYGDVQFVFKKDKISERTFFSIGDSLEPYQDKEATASSLLDPKVSSAVLDSHLEKFMKDEKLHPYIEIQIQNGASLDDVDSVILPKKYEGNDPLGDLLRSKGVKVIYE